MSNLSDRTIDQPFNTFSAPTWGKPARRAVLDGGDGLPKSRLPPPQVPAE
jgi:hypothetical protein